MTNTNPYDAWADRTMSDIDLPNGLINASSGNDVCPSLMTQPIGNGNFYDSARPVVNPTDYSSEYCDRKTPVMDTAFTSIYGPLPNDHRIYNEANVEMEKAYEFAVNHVFVPTGNGDAEEV